MKLTQTFISILLAVFCFLLKAEAVSSRDMLIWGRGADSGGLDPAHETDGESLKVCDNIYEPLVKFADESLDLIPCLATKWEISDDGKTYTFYLREGVRFHDGTPFNARAVEFSFKRQYDETHPCHKYGLPYVYWNNMDMSNIVEDVNVIDEYTVQFILKKRNTPFLKNLQMPFTYIVSPAAVKKYKDKYGTTVSLPAGTGPYKFKEWVKGDKVVLVANEDFWGEKLKIKTVIYKSIEENSVRLLALEKGEIDGMQFPNVEDLAYARRNRKLKIIEADALNVGYLAMNCEKEPFSDPNVRQAVSYAINKKLLVKALYGGIGIPAKNPIPPSMKGYNDDIKDYEYNPRKAKELLKKTKYPKGFKTDLWYMENPRPYMLNPKKIAELIAADLKKIGINVELRTREWSTYLENLENGKHSMALLGWSADNGDPDNFFNILLSIPGAKKPASNVAFYKNEKLQKILDEAQESTDENHRIELYKKSCQIVHDDAPWVPIAHTKQIVITRKNVKGVKVPLITKIVFNTVWKE